MFEKMYERRRAKDGTVGVVKLTPEKVVSLIQSGKRDDLYDMNLIFKRMTKTSVFAVRLFSFITKNKETGLPERVVKFQFDCSSFDERGQQGNKLRDQVKLNMDADEFAYFCDIMRGGRIIQLIERNERKAKRENRKSDPAYDLFKEVNGEQREIKVYRGNQKPICIDVSVTNAQGKNTRLYYGFEINEAGKLGALGAEALNILAMWTAFGKADENLELINARPRKAQSDQSYDRSRPQQSQQNSVRNGYAARSAGNQQRPRNTQYNDFDSYGYQQWQ